jgi:hypothetical protein
MTDWTCRLGLTFGTRWQWKWDSGESWSTGQVKERGKHFLAIALRRRPEFPIRTLHRLKPHASGFGGLGVSALAFRGFKPSRSRRIFQGEKILSAPSFGWEVKPCVPCRWFTACKRSLGVSWKSASRQNYSAISRPHSSGFGYQDRSRVVGRERRLAVKVGTSKAG